MSPCVDHALPVLRFENSMFCSGDPWESALLLYTDGTSRGGLAGSMESKGRGKGHTCLLATVAQLQAMAHAVKGQQRWASSQSWGSIHPRGALTTLRSSLTSENQTPEKQTLLTPQTRSDLTSSSQLQKQTQETSWMWSLGQRGWEGDCSP
jgi:hypothetical protein